MHIRPASIDDLAPIDAIYHHYVVNSHATFELETTSREAWFEFFDGARYQCWVAENPAHHTPSPDGSPAILGYACSHRFRPRGAYRTSIEVSVYLHPEATGRGIGKRLYAALFDSLAKRDDLHRAYAGIALPNAASVALHQSFGFEQVAHFSEVGFKFGKYWDVIWLERGLPIDH